MSILTRPAATVAHDQAAPALGLRAPGVPVLLSLGMGMDSAALLVRWLLDPTSRDFPLSDLIVITAMTGDEYAGTKYHMERYLLPLMANPTWGPQDVERPAYGVRYVQVCRAGQSDSAGIVVLHDSAAQAWDGMHMVGPWRLRDELGSTGTVPQIVTGKRLCSVRAKGWVIDQWVAAHITGPYRHVIGYAAEETKRAKRDTSYTANARAPWYPLIEWGWDRDRCGVELRKAFGVDWPRSCCGYCPFQAGPEIFLLGVRWAADPEACIQALMLEHNAMALNPRSKLFGTRTAREVALSFGLADTVAEADRRIASDTWAVYEVRRVYTAKKGNPGAKGPAWRSVRTVGAMGSRDEIRARVQDAGGMAWTGRDYGIMRAWQRHAGETFPSVEAFTVAAPAGIVDKARAGFETLWVSAGEPPSDALFDLVARLGPPLRRPVTERESPSGALFDLVAD